MAYSLCVGDVWVGFDGVQVTGCDGVMLVWDKVVSWLWCLSHNQIGGGSSSW